MAILRMFFLTALLQLAACTNPPIPRGSIEELFPGPDRPQVSSVAALGRSVQLVQMQGAGKTPIIFIHGSPGSWKAWARFLDAPELAAFGPRIAMDRPGFGGSGAGDLMLDLRAQAAVLAAAMPPGPPAILVGHSLGGPLIAWMAIDHPDKVCGGVMVAGSVAPALEAPRWYNRLAATWIASWFVRKEMRWSNQEMMVLQRQLELLDAHWSELRRPMVAMQGGKDPLVDPRTADYLETRAPRQWMTVVRAAGMDHFLLWTQPGSVIERILGLPCQR
jgi:pimeloyl-ACP methyl ester carboxylesterase